ncbi:MAG: S4 domain-containing protein, partial [Actinomycetota bacterium]
MPARARTFWTRSPRGASSAATADQTPAGSRRACEALIVEGRVTVDGRTAT